MLYDYTNWDKKLLNVGNRARFGNTNDNYNVKSETIYQLTVMNQSGSIIQGPAYTNAAGVLKQKVKNKNNKNIIQAEIVNQPLPLTPEGQIYYSAITNPNLAYFQISFQEFWSISFSYFPFGSGKEYNTDTEAEEDIYQGLE